MAPAPAPPKAGQEDGTLLPWHYARAGKQWFVSEIHASRRAGMDINLGWPLD